MFFLSSAGHRWQGEGRSSQAGPRQHANLAVYVQPLLPAVQHSTGTLGGGERHGALSLVRFHDGVRCALRLYRRQCLYLTSHSSLRARTQPPSGPACVIRTGLSILLTNPKQSLCNWNLVQLLTASTSKPLPSMSSCDSDRGSDFAGSFSISFSNLCHCMLPFSDLVCSWQSLYQ